MILISCSFVFFILSFVITAEETKLQRISVSAGNSITLPCNIIENDEIPTWHINGTAYDVENVLKEFTAHSNEHTASVTIETVKTWMNNTQFQCCFYDDTFCEAAMLIVIIDDSKKHNEIVERFEFNLQGFYFSSLTFTIAWNNAVECTEEDYEYSLIKTLRGENIVMDLGQEMTVTYPKSEFQDGNEDYTVYVLANFNGPICDTTDYAIKLPQYLITETRSTESGGKVCYNYPSRENHISWPIHPGSSIFCDCWELPESFSQCSCVEESTYDVYVEEDNLCFRNITFNNTKIFYFFEFDDEYDNTVREFTFSSNIVIQSVPDAPEIYDYGIDGQGNARFCLNDSFNGYSDIIHYEVIISTSTEYLYQTNISKGEVTIFCYSVENTAKLMIEYCAPQTISIRSLNSIGYSSPQSVSIHKPLSDACKCFKSNVEIKTEILDITSNAAYVSIKCPDISFTDYDIHLEVQVTPSVSSRLQANCSDTLEIEDLTPNTNYSLQTIWKPENKEWLCITENIEYFHTKPEKSSNNDKLKDWGIKIGPAAAEFVIFAIILVILIVIIIILYKKMKNRGER